MNCLKAIFAEVYRLNMLLGPQCKKEKAKTAFEKYEKALHELRQSLECQTQMDECKVSDE